MLVELSVVEQRYQAMLAVIGNGVWNNTTVTEHHRRNHAAT
jgi:hypothetical protein